MMFSKILNQTAIGMSLEIRKEDEINLPVTMEEFEEDYDYLAEDYEDYDYEEKAAKEVDARNTKK